MMKRIVVAAVLGVALSTAAVFAQHPGGTGIGVVVQGGGSWEGGGAGLNNLAFSLKLPSAPIYWGINFNFFENDQFALGVTGDKYLYDQPLVRDINLGWFLGIGGYGNISFYTGNLNNYSNTRLGVGVRVPVGLSIVLARQFEFFVDLAPSIGIGLGFGDYNGTALYGSSAGQHKPLWIDGGWAGDLGFRVWLK